MREMQYFLFRTINIFDIPWHNNDVTNKYFPFNTEFVILINQKEVYIT